MSANEARQVEQEVQARVAVLAGYFTSEIESLNADRATRRRLRRLLSAARSLRNQADAGGATSLVSNGLAIQLLKLEAYVTAAKLVPSLPASFPTAPLENADEMRRTE